MATGRKTGGRQEGTPNKATSTLHELVEAEAGEPLPVILTRIGMQAMKAGYRDQAISALSKAAAYVYPRVPPSEPSEPFRMTSIPPLTVIDGWARIKDDWPGFTIHLPSADRADLPPLPSEVE